MSWLVARPGSPLFVLRVVETRISIETRRRKIVAAILTGIRRHRRASNRLFSNVREDHRILIIPTTKQLDVQAASRIFTPTGHDRR